MRALGCYVAKRLQGLHNGFGQGRADGRDVERTHARDVLCLLIGRKLTVLDQAPSDEERQQSPDGCIDLLKRSDRFEAPRTAYDPGCVKTPQAQKRGE
jgi:hypothetical protein